MKTLIIYDSTGAVFSSPITGGYVEPVAPLNFIEVDIPDGKIIKKVDVSVTPNVAILEDLQKSEVEMLKQRIEEQEAALIELASLIGGSV